MEEGGDNEAVVFGAELDELDGRFEVVEEAMDVGEENLDVAAGLEELCDLEDGYELQCQQQLEHDRTCLGGLDVRIHNGVYQW